VNYLLAGALVGAVAMSCLAQPSNAQIPAPPINVTLSPDPVIIDPLDPLPVNPEIPGPTTELGSLEVGERENILCGNNTCMQKPYAWPDDAWGIVKNGNRYDFYGANAGAYTKCTGTLDDPTAFGCEDSEIQNQRAQFDYMGGGPIHDMGGGRLLMFYHAEIQHPSNWMIFFGAVGMAKSNDNGNNWTDLGLILTHNTPVPEPSQITSTRNMGTGVFVIKREPDGQDYFYVYHENSQGPASPNWSYAFISVARARVVDVINDANADQTPVFRRYCDGQFNGRDFSLPCSGLWTEPGIGGVSTPLENVQTSSSFQHSVSFNTYLNKYIMFTMGLQEGTKWPANPMMYLDSTDGLHWTNRQLVFNENASQWYPMIVGLGENPEHASDQLFWLYYIYCPLPEYTNRENVLARRRITLHE
jgi:hypothetical protein